MQRSICKVVVWVFSPYVKKSTLQSVRVTIFLIEEIFMDVFFLQIISNVALETVDGDNRKRELRYEILAVPRRGQLQLLGMYHGVF